jgi:hypothetical protein
VRLLRDIEAKFGVRDRMHSAEIVAELVSDPESEWADLCGKPLDQRRLARQLKRYGVEPDDIRIGGVVRKGYMVDGGTGLGQAWRRWLSPSGKRDKGGVAARGIAECSAQNHERDKGNTNATAELPPDKELFENVADVADVADNQGDLDLDLDLGPRQPANTVSRPPGEDSETTQDWFTGLRGTLLGDLDARQQQTNGSGTPSESENDDGGPNSTCQECGSRLGSTTGKCVPCIVNRAAART